MRPLCFQIVSGSWMLIVCFGDDVGAYILRYMSPWLFILAEFDRLTSLALISVCV